MSVTEDTNIYPDVKNKHSEGKQFYEKGAFISFKIIIIIIILIKRAV